MMSLGEIIKKYCPLCKWHSGIYTCNNHMCCCRGDDPPSSWEMVDPDLILDRGNKKWIGVENVSGENWTQC